MPNYSIARHSTAQQKKVGLNVQAGGPSADSAALHTTYTGRCRAAGKSTSQTQASISSHVPAKSQVIELASLASLAMFA